MKKDFLSIKDLKKEELLGLIQRGIEIKDASCDVSRSLTGRTLGLLFDKASTRTRVSFEIAMFRLGGQTIFLSRSATQMSRDESEQDTARVLSRYLDGLIIRTYSQEGLEEMAKWAEIPVVNALTDLYHPCQVLSDLLTIKEHRDNLEDMKVAWVGDGNNVAHSWINAAGILGFGLYLACPQGYQPLPDVLSGAGSNVHVLDDPREAVADADVINTDVWVSMGQENEREIRLRDFRGFQLNQDLVKLAGPNVLVMHCLPAHREEEITSEVMDGPHSVVFDQAENKLYLHQALLEKLLIGS